MATALKRGLEELVHDCSSCLIVDETAWHNQHVGIVVLTAEMGNLRNPSETCAHTLMLVERDADTLATAAYGNTVIYLSSLDRFAHSMAEVGIVAAHVDICAEVLVGISMLILVLEHLLLQFEACVVASYSNCLYFHITT